MNAPSLELFFVAFFFVPFFLMILFLSDVFSVFRLGLMEFPEGCGVFGAFLSHVGFEFSPAGSAAGFHFLGFLLRKRGNLFRMNFSSFFGLFLFIGKFCAANERISFRFCRGLFVFGFHKVSGQRSDLIIA